MRESLLQGGHLEDARLLRTLELEDVQAVALADFAFGHETVADHRKYIL